MQSRVLKKSIAAAVGVFFLLVAYYGSYLPLKKSLVFIAALRQADAITSFDEFAEVFSAPLEVPSPIGQEELVRNVGQNILGIVQQTDDPRLIDAVHQLLDKYYAPIIAHGKGTNFAQNVFILGTINEVAYRKTGEARYLEAAERFYLKGLELSPARPQFLYALFALYGGLGRHDEARRIGEQILTQWPTDERTREALSTIGGAAE